MIEVSQADGLLSDGRFVLALPPETVPLEDAAGRILRESLRADRPYPPMDRVCMDGIAVSFLAWKEGIRAFPVTGLAKAGEPRKALASPGECLEVMTGAPCPEGCDIVIPYESISISGESARVKTGLEFRAGQNIHPMGIDCAKDAVLVPEGVRLDASRIAIAASVGKSQVVVTRRPRVTVVATGDELVEVDEVPRPWQLRQSNSHAVRALLSGLAEVRCETAGDDPARLGKVLEVALVESDMVLTSGGVSAGKFDCVPAVLASLGVSRVFHKVAMRPGKPLWFGRGKSGNPVFGLPGNPVSALICARRFVVPVLRAMAEGPPAARLGRIRLGEEIKASGQLTVFLPVRISFAADGGPIALTSAIKGSGDFAGLGGSDGFVELSGGKECFLPGEWVSYYAWAA